MMNKGRRKVSISKGIVLAAAVVCSVFAFWNMCQRDVSAQSGCWLNGIIKAETNDLIYREDTIYLSENTMLEIDLSGMKESGRMKGFYIINCRTGEKNKISSSLKTYGITESGDYIVYGLTSTGKTINLNRNLKIQEQIGGDESGSGFQTI